MAENTTTDDNIVNEGKAKFTQLNIEVDFENLKLHKSKLALEKIKIKDFHTFTMEAFQKHGTKMYEMLGFKKPLPF